MYMWLHTFMPSFQIQPNTELTHVSIYHTHHPTIALGGSCFLSLNHINWSSLRFPFLCPRILHFHFFSDTTITTWGGSEVQLAPAHMKASSNWTPWYLSIPHALLMPLWTQSLISLHTLVNFTSRWYENMLTRVTGSVLCSCSNVMQLRYKHNGLSLSMHTFQGDWLVWGKKLATRQQNRPLHRNTALGNNRTNCSVQERNLNHSSLNSTCYIATMPLTKKWKFNFPM